MNTVTAPLERIVLGIWSKVVVQAVLVPLRPLLREVVHAEASHYLSDIEWRYRQARELLDEAAAPVGKVRPLRKTTAEDLNILRHELTGYTLSDNTNAAGGVAAGSIRWQSLHIVYAGVDYAIADGATLLKYTHFDHPSLTLTSSNTKPTLLANDILLFINNAGSGTVAASGSAQSMPSVLADGAVDNAALANDAVSGSKIANTGIGAGKLGTGAISLATMFVAGAVNTAALAGNAVDSTKLATAVNTSITTAQSTANTGVTNAATAQTQANLGVTNAGIASTAAGVADGKAVTAQGAAATADGKAVTAQGAAATADGKAVTATTNAATADGKAVTADGKAVSAQNKADTAFTNAATAQTQANLGVTNAGLAQTAATTSIVGPTRLNILSHVLY